MGQSHCCLAFFSRKCVILTDLSICHTNSKLYEYLTYERRKLQFIIHKKCISYNGCIIKQNYELVTKPNCTAT